MRAAGTRAEKLATDQRDEKNEDKSPAGPECYQGQLCRFQITLRLDDKKVPAHSPEFGAVAENPVWLRGASPEANPE